MRQQRQRPTSQGVSVGPMMVAPHTYRLSSVSGDALMPSGGSTCGCSTQAQLAWARREGPATGAGRALQTPPLLRFDGSVTLMAFRSDMSLNAEADILQAA